MEVLTTHSGVLISRLISFGPLAYLGLFLALNPAVVIRWAKVVDDLDQRIRNPFSSPWRLQSERSSGLETARVRLVIRLTGASLALYSLLRVVAVVS